MTIRTAKTTTSPSEFSQRSNSNKAVTAATVVGGTALVAYGISRRSWAGAAIAIGGSALAYYGISDASRPFSGKVRIGYTIGASPVDVYAFVRNPNNWVQFLQGLAMESSGTGLKLTFGEAAGFKVISEAAIIDEEPGKFISWNSGAGPLQHRGVIRFKPAPGERGTEISVAFEFKAPAGPVARAVAQFVGWDPEQMVRESLRHLKQILEAHEIPTTANQPTGARGLKGAALRVLYRESTTRDSTDARLAGD